MSRSAFPKLAVALCCVGSSLLYSPVSASEGDREETRSEQPGRRDWMNRLLRHPLSTVQLHIARRRVNRIAGIAGTVEANSQEKITAFETAAQRWLDEAWNNPSSWKVGLGGLPRYFRDDVHGGWRRDYLVELFSLQKKGENKPLLQRPCVTIHRGTDILPTTVEILNGKTYEATLRLPEKGVFTLPTRWVDPVEGLFLLGVDLLMRMPN